MLQLQRWYSTNSCPIAVYEQKHKEEMKIFEITFCGTWILCVCLGKTSGAPASSESPCGSHHSIKKRAPNSDSLTIIYDGLREDAELFARAATKLKTLYIPPEGSRVTGDSNIQKLQSFDIPGLNLPQNIPNGTQDFLRDYEDVSRAGVYIDHVIKDEYTFEKGNYMYYKEMLEMKKQTNVLLCNLHSAIQTVVNSTYTYSTADDVMPQFWRSMESRATRFMRDYVIFHNAENYGNILEQQYSLLLFPKRT